MGAPSLPPKGEMKSGASEKARNRHGGQRDTAKGYEDPPERPARMLPHCGNRGSQAAQKRERAQWKDVGETETYPHRRENGRDDGRALPDCTGIGSG
jgi:hypothetical protein